MESLSLLDFSKCCRLCLSQDRPLSPIFSDNKKSESMFDPSTVAASILACVAIKVESGDNLPNKICNRCIGQIENWLKFKELCDNANTLILQCAAGMSPLSNDENKRLNKRVTDLEKHVDDMEQYSRVNAVEIHGIPYQKNEEVLSVVQEVGKALDMNISETMIDACHRLGKDVGPNNKPPGIIVKFVCRFDKEELLRKRRVKSNLSTRHLNLAMDQPVYVNEALSPTRQRLFAAARQAKRDKHYKYLWVRGGKIFLRKEESAAVVQVTCQTDLNNV